MKLKLGSATSSAGGKQSCVLASAGIPHCRKKACIVALLRGRTRNLAVASCELCQLSTSRGVDVPHVPVPIWPTSRKCSPLTVSCSGNAPWIAGISSPNSVCCNVSPVTRQMAVAWCPSAQGVSRCVPVKLSSSMKTRPPAFPPHTSRAQSASPGMAITCMPSMGISPRLRCLIRPRRQTAFALKRQAGVSTMKRRISADDGAWNSISPAVFSDCRMAGSVMATQPASRTTGLRGVAPASSRTLALSKVSCRTPPQLQV